MTGASLSRAERMDRHYRYQRHIYDLTRNHYLAGRRHLIADLAAAPGTTILEIGCGTAWNLIRASETYPGTRLYGVDISEAMLDVARRSLRRHGQPDRITLAQGDATSFRAAGLFGVASFDRVFFSYALSMIPDWRAALANASAHVAPGGSLHIADFGGCEDLPVSLKRVLFAFLRFYDVIPRAGLQAEVRRLAAEKGFSCHFERRHWGYTHYAVLRRTAG